MSQSRSSQIREQLGHPVIDSDGHFLEYVPFFLDYLRDVGGSEMAARFEAAWAGSFISPRWYELSPEPAVAEIDRRPDTFSVDYQRLHARQGADAPMSLRTIVCTPADNATWR